MNPINEPGFPNPFILPLFGGGGKLTFKQWFNIGHFSNRESPIVLGCFKEIARVRPSVLLKPKKERRSQLITDYSSGGVTLSRTDYFIIHIVVSACDIQSALLVDKPGGIIPFGSSTGISNDYTG